MTPQCLTVIRMIVTVAQIDLRTGVANSDTLATFAHRRGRSRTVSSSWVGSAGQSRAQAWKIAYIRLCLGGEAGMILRMQKNNY